MLDATSHAQTSAKLAAAGGKSIPDYLQGAFPHKDTTDAVAVASIPAATTPAAAEEKVKEKTFRDIIRMTEEDPAQVPFYIKVKGKGKGRPVMFNAGHSSVAQVHEYAAQMSIADPVFTHTASGAAHLRTFTVTVTFDGLSATNAALAGSIKEAKEWACAELVEQMLVRNRDVYQLKA